MPSPLNTSLKPFLSRCDNSSFYVYTSRIVPELALLGYTHVAARLLIRLNNYDFYHDHHGSFRALWFLWDLSEKEEGVPWPGGEKEKVRRAVRDRRAKMSSGESRTNIHDPVTPRDIQEELELIVNEYALKWYYPSEMPGSGRAIAPNPYKLGRPPTTSQMLDSAREIIHSFETARPTQNLRDVRSGLVSALHLVLSAEAHHEQHGTGEVSHRRGSPTSEELLRWLANSLGEKSYETRPATESRPAWNLYCDGALRQQLSLDEAALTAFADDFVEAVIERLNKGRSKLTANLPIHELLKAAEYNTQTNPKARKYNPQPPEASLFNTPATDSQITEAETRLAITLPSDYKTFLRLSNGFGSAWGHPLGDFQPPLHSVDKLRWLDPDSEDYFTDLTLDIPARWDKWPFSPPPTAKPYAADDERSHFLVGRALEIGSEDIDNTWLLPPSTITPIKDAVKKMLDDETLGEGEKGSVRAAIRDFAGSEEGWEKMEWACVTWASGGTAAMFVYPGFRAWLEDVVEEGRVDMEGDDGGEGVAVTEVLRGGKWLGSVFGKRMGGHRVDADADADREDVPGWLQDAVKAALPTRR
jgi:hypothetical protein